MRNGRRRLPVDEPASGAAQIRCAIYRRKSTDEGLGQEFNSLDAQGEAAEAYIASQKHEGWIALPDHYDDGGFTGGNMERPALRRLLADIEAGRIDAVVTYKVDRLSRSLLDFARLMEVFDKHGVRFVAVTQQLDTRSSLGSLSLNVLLSFAQFEREIMAERTRDKISAARRKGKWTGGSPVLGYDVDPRGGRLVVNEDEAARVRAIFQLYLEHRALVGVAREVNLRGWTTKRWTTKDGRDHRGRPMGKGDVYKILTNVTATWNDERPALRDQSCSAYEMALADIGVGCGLTDQMIADLVVAHRSKFSRPKKDRRGASFQPLRRGHDPACPGR